jgi:BASS family bile acid:Na+ symporter
MTPKQLVLLALQTSILSIVFGYGLRATVDDLLYLIRRPALLLRSVAAVFVVMPVLAVLLARLFDFPTSVKVALISLAISPVPPLLPRKETNAGGDAAYAIALMAVLGLLAIVVVPVTLQILASVFERQLLTTGMGVVRIVMITTLVPLAAGMFVRANLPRVADRIERPVAMISKVLLPLALLVLLIATASTLWASINLGTILPMLLFITAGLAVGHAMGGPDPHHALVLALSTACRHPALAMSIAASNFPDQRFAMTIMLYAIVGAIVTIPYLLLERRAQTLLN